MVSYYLYSVTGNPWPLSSWLFLHSQKTDHFRPISLSTLILFHQCVSCSHVHAFADVTLLSYNSFSSLLIQISTLLLRSSLRFIPKWYLHWLIPSPVIFPPWIPSVFLWSLDYSIKHFPTYCYIIILCLMFVSLVTLTIPKPLEGSDCLLPMQITGYLTMQTTDMLLNNLKPQFSHLLYGNNDACITEMLRQSNETMCWERFINNKTFCRG